MKMYFYSFTKSRTKNFGSRVDVFGNTGGKLKVPQVLTGGSLLGCWQAGVSGFETLALLYCFFLNVTNSFGFFNGFLKKTIFSSSEGHVFVSF